MKATAFARFDPKASKKEFYEVYDALVLRTIDDLKDKGLLQLETTSNSSLGILDTIVFKANLVDSKQVDEIKEWLECCVPKTAAGTSHLRKLIERL